MGVSAPLPALCAPVVLMPHLSMNNYDQGKSAEAFDSVASPKTIAAVKAYTTALRRPSEVL